MEEIQIQPSGELMSEGRTVTLFLTQEGKKYPLRSSAMTWGEFQSEHPQFDFRKKSVVIREGRHTLEVDAAELPQGNFTIYAYPKESKSGAVPDEIKALGYNKGRGVAAYLNKQIGSRINISGKTIEILTAIQNVIDNNDLVLSDILKAMKEPKSPKGKAKKEEPKAQPSKAKKSVKSKLAKEVKPEPVVAQDVPIEPVKEEEVKKSEPGFCTERIVNQVVSERLDIHLHIPGLESYAQALKFDAMTKLAALGQNRAAIADKVAEVLSIDLDKALAQINLTKEQEAKKAQELLDKQAAEELKLKEAEAQKKRIQEAEELRRKEAEEDEALRRDAAEVGRGLKR